MAAVVANNDEEEGTQHLLDKIIGDEDSVFRIGQFLVGVMYHFNRDHRGVTNSMLVSKSWKDAFGLALAQIQWDSTLIQTSNKLHC